MKFWVCSIKGGMELTSLNLNTSLNPGEPLSVFNDKTPTPYLQTVTRYISHVTSLP